MKILTALSSVLLIALAGCGGGFSSPLASLPGPNSNPVLGAWQLTAEPDANSARWPLSGIVEIRRNSQNGDLYLVAPANIAAIVGLNPGWWLRPDESKTTPEVIAYHCINRISNKGGETAYIDYDTAVVKYGSSGTTFEFTSATNMSGTEPDPPVFETAVYYATKL
ncbi:MAG: hypothetical protein HRF49_07975 [bacterium]|jgi:hypothetical protein